MTQAEEDDQAPPDTVIGSLSELMAALRVETIPKLEGRIEDFCAWAPDVYIEEESDEETLIISMGGMVSNGYPYPFTLTTFWLLVEEQDWEGLHLSEWQQLGSEIADVEGFAVEVYNYPPDADWEAVDRADKYPYQRAAPDHWSVSRWIEKRFRSHYAGFSIQVQGPGSTARGNLRLSTLRQRWIDSGRDPSG